jgi:hypothetical protein
MRQYIDTLQDVQGNALVGATVLVQNYIGGANASIFSDNGLTPILTSTVTTGSDGQFSFFAADGNYNLVMSNNATIFKTQSPVVIFDGAAQLTFTDTGAANAYAVSNSDLEKALRTGLRAYFLAANSNTGPSTFAYNGLAAKPIVLPAAIALFSNVILVNGIYGVEYDGTNWQLRSVPSSGPFYAISTAETNAGVTPTNYNYPVGYVDRYGTNTTPGTTDMTVAIKTAWNVMKAQGGGKMSFVKGIYAMSTLDPASPINLASQNSNGSIGTQAYQTQVYCLGGSNIVIDFAGAQIKSTITGGGVGFLFDNCQNISLLNPNMTGTQVQTTGVAALGAITGGTLYVNGTYTDVPLTGGTGNGAHASITVAGGAVSSVTIIYPGGGYVVNDTLSASNANLGGAGSGFSVPVTSVTGVGNVVGTAAVLPFCITSLSGVSQNITFTDLTTNTCYTGVSVIDGTNTNITQCVSLLGHTSVSNGEYGVTFQGGCDDVFIANLETYRVNRPYFIYGCQNVAIANLDAQQTNYGFGALLKAYNRSTRNITINEVFRNAPGNNTSRLSIQVQCDPTVITTPPTVKNVWITHDESGQPLQTGTCLEFDYFAGSGGTVQTATSANQLFDQIAFKGFCTGYLFSTVQLTTAAAQCQINYDNLEANWSGIVGSGQDIRTGLGFISSREFFGNMSLQFGGTTVAGTGGAVQVFISDGFCKVQGTMTLTAKNGAGQATIVLPFKSRLDNNTNSVGPALAVSNFAALGGAMVGVLPGNSNLMNLYTQAATGEQSVLDTNFTATSSMYFDITYPI